MDLTDRCEKLAAQALDAARSDWSRAESKVSRVLREARHLPSRERRQAQEAVWEAIRRWRWAELLEGPNGEAGACFAATRDENRLRSALDQVDDEMELLAIRHSLPTWLVRRLVADLDKAQVAALAGALELRSPLCIRANLPRTSRDELARRLAREGVDSSPTRIARAGLVLSGHPNVRSLAAWKEGLFEVQDEGSQIVTEMVEASAGGLIVDACAGAGGKALGLAARHPGAKVVAVDVDRRRLQELRTRQRRAQADNIESFRLRAVDPAPKRLVGAADAVLVDAPCSGTGTLGRHPALRWALTAGDIDDYPARQVDLCVRFAELVRSGGQLVYAVCSVLQCEGEEVLEEADRRLPGFQVTRKRRLWPQRDGTDGFFVGVFQRV